MYWHIFQLWIKHGNTNILRCFFMEYPIGIFPSMNYSKPNIPLNVESIRKWDDRNMNPKILF